MTEPARPTAPADLVAEEALIGAMLLSRDAIEAVADIVRAGDFYKPAFGHIFDAAVSLWRGGQGVDAVTVASELRHRQLAEAVGGDAVLVEAMSATPATSNAARYARIVAEKAGLRRIAVLAGELSERALDPGGDPADVLDWLKAKAAEVEVPIDGLPVGVFSVDDFLARPEARVRPWVVPGLFRRGWRVVLVAEEGAGKSTIGRQIALAAGQGRHPFAGNTVEPIKALVVDFENPEDVVADGFGLILDPLKGALRGTYTEHRAWIWHRPEGVNVRTRAGRGQLEAAVAAIRPDLVCLGPLYKAFRTKAGEQWDDAAGEVCEVFDSLKERYGFALLVEHHAPKKQGGVREMMPFGSGVWLRWPELGLTLVRDPKRNAAGQNEHYLRGRYRLDRVRHAWPTGLSHAARPSLPWEARWDDGNWKDPDAPAPTEEAPF